MFRTRIAPSPTGFLHLGTARTLLFTVLFAKVVDGIWYVRCDDTDRKRLQPEAFVNLLECMENLGINPPEGVSLDKTGFRDSFYGAFQKGEFGPYIQSERLKIYHEHAQRMIDRKLAYWTFLDENDKAELVQIKTLNKLPINYWQETLKTHSEEEMFMSVQKGLVDPRECALRFRLQCDRKLQCQDELLGNLEIDLNLEEDFIILKNDGFPTYALAHVIDDHLMQTTLVIRSQEWLPSLSRHWAMFAKYWEKVPKFLHLPFVLGETGNKKMSKRDGNVNMTDYLAQGYLPEAMLNYLAFLGWNPGTEKEIYLDKSDFANFPKNSLTNT